ncbi:MAG: hypothetical protein B6U95_10010 [Thermofilum sp. ex4484_82]|nr:MAG: hypothetical protein B6U95_10010 [Thermofilum sp. ex4484_82]OYT35600.1 MAG: hypothetical protein B6U96_10020 [Archaeoglobales archaeon ex4484_92]
MILKVGKNDLPSDEAHEVSSSNIKEIQREIRTGRAVVALPLVGYGIKIPRGETGEIIKKVLEEEGIKPEDFRVKSMPELSVKGAVLYSKRRICNYSFKRIYEAPRPYFVRILTFTGHCKIISQSLLLLNSFIASLTITAVIIVGDVTLIFTFARSSPFSMSTISPSTLFLALIMISAILFINHHFCCFNYSFNLVSFFEF